MLADGAYLVLRPDVVWSNLHPLPPVRGGALPVTSVIRAAPLLVMVGLALASPFLFDALSPLLSH